MNIIVSEVLLAVRKRIGIVWSWKNWKKLQFNYSTKMYLLYFLFFIFNFKKKINENFNLHHVSTK